MQRNLLLSSLQKRFSPDPKVSHLQIIFFDEIFFPSIFSSTFLMEALGENQRAMAKKQKQATNRKVTGKHLPARDRGIIQNSNYKNSSSIKN